MTTYNSYEAAKIANPESNIWHLNGGLFASGNQTNIPSGVWKECDPMDFCMTVERFLADGYKFVEGDVLLTVDKLSVKVVGRNDDRDDMSVATCNTPMSDIDCDVLILRAAALEEKKPRTKVEYVEVTDSIFDLRPDFEAGELYFRWLGNGSGAGYDKITTEKMLFCRYEEGRLLRRIETPMTEREAFIEALQELWIIDGVDGKEQMDKIVDSGLFKLVN